MHFSSDFKVASKDILEKVGQEATLECGEKGAKSKCEEYRDRFSGSNHSNPLLLRFTGLPLKLELGFESVGTGVCSFELSPISSWI